MPLLSTYASATGRSYGARLETPVPIFLLSTSGGATSVNEGSSLTFIIGGSFISDGTYYWTINNITSADADFSAVSGSFTMTSNSGTFSISTTADVTTEGSQTFTVSVRTISISGEIVATSDTITINDTSVTQTLTFSPAFGGSTSVSFTTGTTLASTSCGSWTMTPSSTFTAMVKCWGGGGGGSINQGVNIRSYGGGGGYYDAFVVFEAGVSYQLRVGCGGGASGSARTAAGGGGGTAVRRVTGSIYMLGAGGGGGGGVSDTGGAQAGAGGGDVGQTGSGGSGRSGGGGGTQSAAGAGGVGTRRTGSPGSGNNGGAGAGSASTSGGAGIGNGGSGGFVSGDNGGGGGGGGYFGGGGGGGDAGGDAGGGGSGSANLTYVYNQYGLTGSGSTPGNSSDSDRGTAGQGGTNNTAGTIGKIHITIL